MIRIFGISLFSSWILSFIPAFLKYVLSTYYVPGSVPSARGIRVGKPDITPASWGFQSVGKGKCQAKDYMNTSDYVLEEAKAEGCGTLKSYDEGSRLFSVFMC